MTYRSYLLGGVVAGLALVIGAPEARADAAGDLAAGRAALAAGDLPKAKTLLTAAAQTLPESVEAQLALADASLQSGDVEAALAGYRKVLKLSPEHAGAKRLVDALTGKQQTVEQRIASAEALLKVGAYTQADTLLVRLADEPVTAADRQRARLLLAKSRLWSNSLDAALADAVRVAQEAAGTPAADEAQVIIALALVAKPDSPQKPADILKLIDGDKAAKADWKPWSELVKLIIQLEDESNAVKVSESLMTPLESIPAGNYRTALVDRLARRMLQIARQRLGEGDIEKPLAIVWPMVSKQAAPGADAVLKPVEITGGWLGAQTASIHFESMAKVSSNFRFEIAQILQALGSAEFDRRHGDASLRGYWLAAELLRQLPETSQRAEHLLALAGNLAGLSRPGTDRKPGGEITLADRMQRTILLQTVPLASSEQQRTTIFDQAINLVGRYAATDELELGLTQFVVVANAEKSPAVTAKLVSPLDRLPPGAAKQKLLQELAAQYAKLGVKEFGKAASSAVAEPNAALNRFDRVALALLGQQAVEHGDDTQANVAANEIIERYVAADRWAAATEAMTLFYAPLKADAGAWAAARMKLRQAQHEEDKLLSGNRRLGEQLSPLVKEALEEVRRLLSATPNEATRQSATQLADTLITRYAGLQRYDLAEAVIAIIAEAPGKTELADWALWRRADLLDHQATRAIRLAVAKNEDNSGLPLNAAHKQELSLLAELVSKHANTAYAAQAVARVVQISSVYQQYHAFKTADAVLTDFLQVVSKLGVAERLEYAHVQLLLAKARVAFDKRDAKAKLAKTISDEYTVALDALGTYLKAHPTGEYAVAAENAVLEIARLYGQDGQWAVAREVIARFAAAVPDFHSPGHLKLLEAATYLGELDTPHGLQLLSAINSVQHGHDSTETDVALANARDFGDTNGTFAFRGGAARSGPGYGAPGEMAASGKGGSGALTIANGPGTATAFAGGALAPPVTALPELAKSEDKSPPAGRPSDMAIAMIRQSEQQQLREIAMLKDDVRKQPQDPSKPASDITLPAGVVLSEAEMKRQDTAADKAYAILLALAKQTATDHALLSEQARSEILWMFSFFEGKHRSDRAVAMIRQYLKDRPTDVTKVALEFRAITDEIVWAGQRQPSERLNQAWLDAHHKLFDTARASLEAFIKTYAAKTEWTNQARLLLVDSYQRESDLAAAISKARAGGLLVRSVEALLELLESAPEHPEIANFPARLWNVAERLRALGQNEQSIFVLGQLPKYFPTDAHAQQAILRIAEEYAANLANPLKAVETYQEYLSLVGDNEAIRTQIFSIGQQLNSKRRYLESLHVFGVFVDSFPADPRAPEALRAIGHTHQSNEAWEEAIAAYQRILGEFPSVAIIPQVKLAVAECHINLSHWKEARRLYNEYALAYTNDPQTAMAKSRMEILKNLDRYQTLLADDQVQRNKDDAQFQIGRIVNEQLSNPIKAIAEFRKVVSNFPKSDLADDAQFEIGKALLGLNRLEEARDELLRVPRDYATSPLADDALFLVGQTFERQAQRLATVTVETAKAEAYEMNQRGAYRAFKDQLQTQDREQSLKRDLLRKAGKKIELALEEANSAAQLGGQADLIGNSTRQAELKAEAESALQVANRQDRINDAYRQAVAMYAQVAKDYPLGDMTDKSLLRMAQILETELKDRKAAMKTYQDIVKFFPGTPVAEDAAWKVASFYDQEGKYDEAVRAYREFIRNYPASGRVADAQFALAESLEQLGRWVEAMDAYETFRQKFNAHPKAQVAQEQINWIKAYRK